MSTPVADEKVDLFQLASDDDHRQFIQNIVDSYHHDWDVLSELCQNAVDAIREKTAASGRVDLLFDRTSRSIQVTDTGIGMTRDKVSKALKPNVTFKKGHPTLIGEKGLGLTFCAFRTNKITLETSIGDGFIHTVVFEGGRDWIKEIRTEKPLAAVVTRSEASGSFTRVTAEDVNADFTLEWPRLRHLLLTKTALGCTYPIWPELQKNPNIEIVVNIIEEDSSSKEETLPHCYWHPADYLAHKKSLHEVRELAQNNKMRDFKGWGLTDKRELQLAAKPAYFYSLMLSVPEYDRLAEAKQPASEIQGSTERG